MARPRSEEELVRTAITLPKSMHSAIEEEARQNKLAGNEPKTVSALIREALEIRAKYRSSRK